MSKLSNKLIAKNTLMLYVRMFVIMAVSLYTSRVVLQVLGVNDYGVYNLVAGFVTIFSFISNALVSAIQRYFNVALGTNNKQYYKDIYSSSINVMLLFSVIIFILGETIGLWFVRTQLNIAADRMYAAEWVFHISLLTFIVNLFRTTFNASIIAHERMNFYAYISILEAAVKLGVVFLLRNVNSDKLITYAWFYFATPILILVISVIYCHRQFEECRYSPKINKTTFKAILNFSELTLIEQSAIMFRNQCESVLINRFFSVVANAALGIANQVSLALGMFVSNFQTAFNPQIIKTYAAGEIEQHHTLVCRASKFSYYLLLVVSLPIVFNINIILGWWLSTVPYQANYFCVFIIISYLINSLGAPLNTSIFASGNIRRYQITNGILIIMGLLLSICCLWLGGPPYSIVIVANVVNFLLLVNRLWHATSLTHLRLKYYLKKTIVPVFVVTILYVPVVFFTSLLAHSIIDVAMIVCIDVLCAIFFVLFCGLETNERKFIIELIKTRIPVFNKNAK